MNAQPSSGNFSVFLDIKEGDTAALIKNKIAKFQKCGKFQNSKNCTKLLNAKTHDLIDTTPCYMSHII